MSIDVIITMSLGFIAVFLLAVFTWMLLDLLEKSVRGKRVAKRELVLKNRFSPIIDQIIDSGSDPHTKKEWLKMDYASVYKPVGDVDSAIPDLIKALIDHHAEIMEKGIGTSLERAVIITEVIEELKKDAPFSALPTNDRKAVIAIKNSLQNQGVSQAINPLLAHITDLIVDKNSEIEKYRQETTSANNTTKKSYLLSIVSVIMGLLMAIWSLYLHYFV